MRFFVRCIIKTFDSWISAGLIVLFCAFSFYIGKHSSDMNLFAASGGVMTIFGLLSMARFSTMEKYLQQEEIIQRSSGVTGPPLADGESEKIAARNRAAARIRIQKELYSDFRGLFLTVAGTIVWAYGQYF
ncbi:MAG: hypothetical protein KA735_15025 [Burkholderiaceae bacterium]|nr:hypothetical protein [Burkholderiaceae bacterium]